MNRMKLTQAITRTLFAGFALAMTMSFSGMNIAHAAKQECPYKKPYRPVCEKRSCSRCACSRKGKVEVVKKVRLQVVGSLKKTTQKACAIAKQLGKIECRKQGYVKKISAKKVRQYRKGSNVWCEVKTTCQWRYNMKCSIMEAKVKTKGSKLANKTLNGVGRNTDKRKACYDARIKVINDCRRLKGQLVRRKCSGSNVTRLTCEAYNQRSGVCIHVGHCSVAKPKMKLSRGAVCWCVKPRLTAKELVLLRKYR